MSLVTEVTGVSGVVSEVSFVDSLDLSVASSAVGALTGGSSKPVNGSQSSPSIASVSRTVFDSVPVYPLSKFEGVSSEEVLEYANTFGIFDDSLSADGAVLVGECFFEIVRSVLSGSDVLEGVTPVEVEFAPVSAFYGHAFASLEGVAGEVSEAYSFGDLSRASLVFDVVACLFSGSILGKPGFAFVDGLSSWSSFEPGRYRVSVVLGEGGSVLRSSLGAYMSSGELLGSYLDSVSSGSRYLPLPIVLGAYSFVECLRLFGSVSELEVLSRFVGDGIGVYDFLLSEFSRAEFAVVLEILARAFKG